MLKDRQRGKEIKGKMLTGQNQIFASKSAVHCGLAVMKALTQIHIDHYSHAVYSDAAANPKVSGGEWIMKNVQHYCLPAEKKTCSHLQFGSHK